MVQHVQLLEQGGGISEEPPAWGPLHHSAPRVVGVHVSWLGPHFCFQNKLLSVCIELHTYLCIESGGGWSERVCTSPAFTTVFLGKMGLGAGKHRWHRVSLVVWLELACISSVRKRTGHGCRCGMKRESAPWGIREAIAWASCLQTSKISLEVFW